MSNINRKRRIITSPGGTSGGGGTDPADKTRITNLENNEYKIIYWEAVSTDSGTITKPTNSTILLDSLQQGIDAIVETIIGGQPSGFSPITSGGAYVTVSSFDTAGNFTLSGVPSAYPVAIVYIIKTKALDYANINNSFVLTAEPINSELISNKDASGGYAGLTALKINFKNAANTFTSFFTNSNTAARTYTFPDRNGLISDKGYQLICAAGAFSPADNTTYYIGALYALNAVSLIDALARQQTFYGSGVITKASIIIYAITNGSSESSTLNLRIDDTTNYLIHNAVTFNATPKRFEVTGLNIPFTDAQKYVIQMVSPTNWVTNPLNIFMQINLYAE